MDESTPQHSRTVAAPQPFPHSARRPPNLVLTVTVGDDEEVEWLWATTQDGISYVSGYNIVKRRDAD